ncbi:MAG: hypothetical protein GXP55_20860 [Deltaproteobacteria bacterium]|nr:hypothetical protein [Deltaproteobacteria bacterium]
MTRHRPTRELILRRVRLRMFVVVPLFSAVAGGLIVMQVNPVKWQLPLAGAISTAFFASLLVFLRLGAPKRRHFLGVLAVAAFFGALNAPVVAVLAGPSAMGVESYAQLMGYALFGAIVFSPASGALGAGFGLAWLATLTRFSRAEQHPALMDVPSLMLRLGAGVLGLAALSAASIALAAPRFRPLTGREPYALVHGAEPLPMALGLGFLLFGGLALIGAGLWSRRRFRGLLRAASTGEHEEFCLAPVDLADGSTKGLLAITRDRVCTRVLCRRHAVKGDGAYRLNRDHLTPWALMP